MSWRNGTGLKKESSRSFPSSSAPFCHGWVSSAMLSYPIRHDHEVPKCDIDERVWGMGEMAASTWERVTM